MQLKLHFFDLPLKHTFRIAHDSRDVQKTLVAEVLHEGISGFGEATASNYYHISTEQSAKDLEMAFSHLKPHHLQDPEAAHRHLLPYLRENTFAHCALDEALWDWWGKKQQQPLHQLWGLDLSQYPVTNYTIGIGPLAEMVEKLRATNWPIYKIKLGTDDDLQIVRELRKHTDAPFRVDANCAWDAPQTLKFAQEMRHLNVEFIEQPLAADDWDGMKMLFEQSPLPLLADESCIKEEDVDKCTGYFHGINLKLTKCGGLTPARRMIARARELGMKVMAGCMTESTVGISALAQLLPLLDYVDMDGPLLIAKDIATGIKLVDGETIFPDKPGTGVELLL